MGTSVAAAICDVLDVSGVGILITLAEDLLVSTVCRKLVTAATSFAEEDAEQMNHRVYTSSSPHRPFHHCEGKEKGIFLSPESPKAPKSQSTSSL